MKFFNDIGVLLLVFSVIFMHLCCIEHILFDRYENCKCLVQTETHTLSGVNKRASRQSDSDKMYLNNEWSHFPSTRFEFGEKRTSVVPFVCNYVMWQFIVMWYIKLYIIVLNFQFIIVETIQYIWKKVIIESVLVLCIV